MPAESGLLVTIDRLEENNAVIRTDDGQELVIDLALLPPSSQEGSQLWLNFSANKAGTISQEQLAKVLLKEILGNRNNAKN
ncbi:MAG: DUF3006 domain-containing protein [Patescibacteria group bacterium]